jgi:hypothetical protein
VGAQAVALRDRAMDDLANAYGPYVAMHHCPSAAWFAKLMAADPDWSEQQLLEAAYAQAEASAAGLPEPERPPKPQRRPVVAPVEAHHRRTHRAGHRGPVARRPGARRTRRVVERAGPNDDPGPAPLALGGAW